jgi:hypothetical protein
MRDSSRFPSVVLPACIYIKTHISSYILHKGL